MSIHEIDLALLVFGAAVLIGGVAQRVYSAVVRCHLPAFVAGAHRIFCRSWNDCFSGFFYCFLFDSSRARDGAGAASAAAARDPFAF